LWLRLSTSKVISQSSQITIGLTFKLCGATGVIAMVLEWGTMIGPPTLNEYAVEPVGVAIMSPSAW
jgi:hypothetical protein